MARNSGHLCPILADYRGEHSPIHELPIPPPIINEPMIRIRVHELTRFVLNHLTLRVAIAPKLEKDAFGSLLELSEFFFDFFPLDIIPDVLALLEIRLKLDPSLLDRLKFLL
jgi:hypothetical protein